MCETACVGTGVKGKRTHTHTPALHTNTVWHITYSVFLLLWLLKSNFHQESSLEPLMDDVTHLSVYLSTYGPIPLMINEEIYSHSLPQGVTLLQPLGEKWASMTRQRSITVGQLQMCLSSEPHAGSVLSLIITATYWIIVRDSNLRD